MPDPRISSADIPRRIFTFTPLISAFLILTWGLLWWQYTVDDTFITLRYAANLADCAGAVFNHGEYTEGYSSPAWVLVLALISKLGFDPLTASRLIGLFSSFLLCLLMYSILRRMTVDPLIGSLAVITLATIPGMHIHGVSGMETLPFALVIALLIALPYLTSAARIQAVLLPPLLLLTAALRPEGMLLFTAISLLWFLREKSAPLRIGIVMAWAALIVLLLFRYAYYGSFLPNTWLAKPSPVLYYLSRAPFSAESLHVLFRSVGEAFLAFPGGLPGVLILLPLIFSRSLRTADTATLSTAAAAATGGAFILYAAQDWMPGYRFALPYVFPLLLLAVWGTQSLLLRVTVSSDRRRRVLISLAALLIVYNTGTTVYWLYRYQHNTVNPALDAEQYAPIGKWIRANSRVGDTILAYEVGAIAYYSKRSIVDYEGLVTKEIAEIIHTTPGYDYIRYGGDTAAMHRIVAECAARTPDFLLLRSSDSSKLTLGQPVSPAVAAEAIQRALVVEFGSSMVLRAVFPLKLRDTTIRDRYLLLGRRPPPLPRPAE